MINDFKIKALPSEYLTIPLITAIIDNVKKNCGKEIDPNEAASIVAYNVITPLQLSVITNRGISSIQNLMRPKQTAKGIITVLTKVFPFKAGDECGPVFVLFDKNCFEYILSTHKPDKNGAIRRTNPIIKGERRSEVD